MQNAFNLKRPNAAITILVFVFIRNVGLKLKLINFMMKSKYYFNNLIGYGLITNNN